MQYNENKQPVAGECKTTTSEHDMDISIERSVSVSLNLAPFSFHAQPVCEFAFTECD